MTVRGRRNDDLPPILAGRFTPAVSARVREFFFSVESMFESWLARRNSPHTQRAYREDVMAFVRFVGIARPEEAPDLLKTTVKEVQAFRAVLYEKTAAPKTINRRISSLSSFFKYMAAAAANFDSKKRFRHMLTFRDECLTRIWSLPSPSAASRTILARTT